MMELPPAEAAKRAQEIGAQEARRSEREGQSLPGSVHRRDLFFVIIGSDRAAARRPPLSPARRDQPLGHPVGPRRAEPRSRGGGGWGGGGGGGGWGGGGGSAASPAAAARSAAAARRGDGDVRLSEDDHARVSAAIAAAEAKSDGEIVAIAADQSDAYHDVGLHYAVLVLFLVLAFFAVWPHQLELWWITA